MYFRKIDTPSSYAKFRMTSVCSLLHDIAFFPCTPTLVNHYWLRFSIIIHMTTVKASEFYRKRTFTINNAEFIELPGQSFIEKWQILYFFFCEYADFGDIWQMSPTTLLSSLLFFRQNLPHNVGSVSSTNASNQETVLACWRKQEFKELPKEEVTRPW